MKRPSRPLVRVSLLVTAGVLTCLAALVAARRHAPSFGPDDLLPLDVRRVTPIVREPAVSSEVEATAAAVLPDHASEPLRLVVTKSERVLRVLAAGDGRTIKAFPCALGGQPSGAKEREGDERTPEGRYALIPHHESPAFGACFFVCYPNEADAARASASGLVTARQAAAIRDAGADGGRPPQDTPLGGLILVHGTRDRSRGGLTLTDWTLGCIALENRDLLELLAAFGPSDRPEIDILP